MRQLDTLLQRVQSEYALRLAAEERLLQVQPAAAAASVPLPSSSATGSDTKGEVSSQTSRGRRRTSGSSAVVRAGTWSPPHGPHGGSHAAAGHSHQHAAGQQFLRSTTYRPQHSQRSRSVSPRGSMGGMSQSHPAPARGGSVYSLEDVPPLDGSGRALSDLMALREEAATLRSELAHAQAAQDSSAAQLQDMTQEMQDGRLALAEKNAELRQLRSELVAARQAARAAVARAKEAESSTADARGREASLKTRLEAVRAAMNKHEKAAARSAKLSTRCSNAEEQTSRLRATVTRMRRQLDEAHAREKALQSQAEMEGRAMRTVLARADALLGEQAHMQNTLQDLEQELEDTRQRGDEVSTIGSAAPSFGGVQGPSGAWDMQAAATRSPPPPPPAQTSAQHNSSTPQPTDTNYDAQGGHPSVVTPESLAGSNAALAAALAASQAKQADAEGQLGQLRGTVRTLRGRLAESHAHRQALMQQTMHASPLHSGTQPPVAAAAATAPRPGGEGSPSHGDRSPLRFPAREHDEASDDLSPDQQSWAPKPDTAPPRVPLSHIAGGAARGDQADPPPAANNMRQLSGYAADNEGRSSAAGSEEENAPEEHAAYSRDTSGFTEPTPYTGEPPCPTQQTSPGAGSNRFSRAAPPAMANIYHPAPGLSEGWSAPWAPDAHSASATPRPWAPPVPSTATPATGMAAQGPSPAVPPRRRPTTEEEVSAGLALLHALMAEQRQ